MGDFLIADKGEHGIDSAVWNVTLIYKIAHRVVGLKKPCGR
ncbi:MAG: hypothetical protein QFX33_02530 [Candidatus Nezhaarchaeota archaeon]|nr:hypothetical protein [Candidatus Nezhaarchaeota archaeon]